LVSVRRHVFNENASLSAITFDGDVRATLGLPGGAPALSAQEFVAIQ
jgi:hypothetical protein